MARTARQRLGAAIEARAAALLAAAGLAIVERNWRCVHGEVDIIARDGPALVFVEVRARASAAWGGARASITRVKQARIARCAQQYLQRAGYPTPPCRFDLVLCEAGTMEWLRDAFGMPADESS